MKDWLLGMAKSRKNWLVAIGFLVAFLNQKWGWNLDAGQLAVVLIPLAATILGIAIEDHGEKANPNYVEIVKLREGKKAG